MCQHIGVIKAPVPGNGTIQISASTSLAKTSTTSSPHTSHCSPRWNKPLSSPHEHCGADRTVSQSYSVTSIASNFSLASFVLVSIVLAIIGGLDSWWNLSSWFINSIIAIILAFGWKKDKGRNRPLPEPRHLSINDRKHYGVNRSRVRYRCDAVHAPLMRSG